MKNFKRIEKALKSNVASKIVDTSIETLRSKMATLTKTSSLNINLHYFKSVLIILSHSRPTENACFMSQMSQ